MNGHHKEVEGTKTIVLNLSQEEVSDSDEVTDAISKLQQNGVNCIFFTKKELENLNNNHGKDLFKRNIRRKKEQEQPNLNDLLDYEPETKSINASSLTIQFNNHNCLVTPQHRNGQRRKGKRKVKAKWKGCKGQKSGVINFPEKRKILGKLGTMQQGKNVKHTADNRGDDHLTNGFSTPPPCLSPQCSDNVLQQQREHESAGSAVESNEERTPSLEPSLPCEIPLLTPFVVTDSTEMEVTDAVKETMSNLLDSVTRIEVNEVEDDGGPGKSLQSDHCLLLKKESMMLEALNPASGADAVEIEGDMVKDQLSEIMLSYDDTSLPLVGDKDSAMKLRHSTPDGSFYSLVTNNVRFNLENFLDGRVDLPKKLKGSKAKRRKRYKNGYLLYHGDNYPQDPELSYQLNLTTQILLKLNRKRFNKSKTDKRKTVLAYLSLVSKRPVRAGKFAKVEEVKAELAGPIEERSLFSGEWTLENKYVCGICRHEETDFWDMVTHKGEEHSGVVVTHVELPVNQEVPNTLIRQTAQVGIERSTTDLTTILSCTKCSAKFSTLHDMHRHIFECAGNTDWLEDQKPKKSSKSKRRRRQGFKRRLLNNSPRKNGTAAIGTNLIKAETPTKRKGLITSGSTTNLYKCKFCVRHFKTEGWLKNHLATHTLLVSIPFSKLPKQNPALALPQLPQKTRASNWSLRTRYTRAVVAAQ